MKRTVSILVVGLAVVCAAAVMAHEGHEHAADKVMGTVVQVHTAADVTHIELKTSGGETITLTADAATKYVKGKTPAALADLKAGIRIVATVTKEGQVNKVAEIQIGGSDPAPHKH